MCSDSRLRIAIAYTLSRASSLLVFIRYRHRISVDKLEILRDVHSGGYMYCGDSTKDGPLRLMLSKADDDRY